MTIGTIQLISGDRDGATYERSRDLTRLNGQALAVYNVMSSGNWYTLSLLSKLADAPEASVSARLRDLRKPKFGGFDIQSRYLGCGMWQYRMAL